MNEAERALLGIAPAAFTAPQPPATPTIPPSSTSTDYRVRDRARAYLQSMGPAIEGQGGDQHTYRAACVLVKDFDLDDGSALALLSEWNSTCSPPWDARDLEAKVQRARRYGAHGAGAKLQEAKPAVGRRESDEWRLAPPPLRKLPQIDAGDLNLPVVSAAALKALIIVNDPPELFRFGGLPVRIERDELKAPIVRPLTEDRLRYHMARAADWVTVRKIGTHKALPPIHVVRDLLAHPSLPLPVLERIVEAPVFTQDGRIHSTPGFSTAHGLYYAPDPSLKVPPVPPAPTNRDIEAARNVFDDLFHDFPFVGPAEFAHTLALLLLPFLRNLIDGPTPLHLVEKPSPGTGAGLLVDVVLWPALGRSAPLMVYAENETETQKKLLAKLVTNSTAIVLDNVRRRIDSASISAAITATVYEDRVLSTSTTVRIPVTCAWVATANNPALSNEIARRTIRIRLDARTDQPWLRTGFKHPDLRAWVREARPQLVWAALTLGQAWIAAGRPPGLARMGHFERWADVLGGVLDVAGVKGFLGNLAEFYSSADEEARTMSAFVGAWWDTFNDDDVGVKALWKLINPDGESDRDPIPLDLGDKGEKSQRTRLGKLLHSMRDRAFDGKRIEERDKKNNAQQWRLVRLD